MKYEAAILAVCALNTLCLLALAFLVLRKESHGKKFFAAFDGLDLQRVAREDVLFWNRERR